MRREGNGGVGFVPPGWGGVATGKLLSEATPRFGRKAVLTRMVLSGFLLDAGEYPVLPPPLAPIVPFMEPLKLDDTVSIETVDGVRGLRLRTPLKKYDVVYRIPRSNTIEVTRSYVPGEELEAKADRVLGLRRSFWSEELRVVRDWRLRLALQLLIEIRQNPALLPYFALLPRNIDVPVFWTKDEVARLQHFELQLRVLRQKVQWEKICELIQQNTSTLDVREVLWALSIVRSRAFSAEYLDRSSLISAFAACWTAGVSLPMLASVNQEASLVGTGLFVGGAIFTEISNRGTRRKGFLSPVADMMNHATGSKVKFTYDATSDAYLISTGSEAKEGEELFFEYNANGKARSNDQLLQFYGFLEEGNPEMSYLFCETLSQFFKDGRYGLDLASVEGLALTKQLLSRRSEDGGGVELTIDEDGNPAFNKSFMKVVRKTFRRERKISRFLADICIQELAEKSTTIAEDGQELSKLRSKSGANPRKMLAVSYRLQCKKLLRKAVEYFSKN